MILLTKGQMAEHIIVTLNEKKTIDSGYYLFLFTHMVTMEVVSKIYSFLADQSDFQDRYNDFEIDTQTVFGDSSIGFWTYKVYEQVSSSNTDPDGLTLVERGIMRLDPVEEFAFTEYEAATSFKMYQG